MNYVLTARTARFAILLAFFLGSSARAVAQDSFDLSAPAHVDKPISLFATHYKRHDAPSYDGPGKVPIHGPGGASLQWYIKPLDFCHGANESILTVHSSSGSRTFIYKGVGNQLWVDCRRWFSHGLGADGALALGKSVFAEAPDDAPFGVGSPPDLFRLVPFRTVAVDPRCIPLGSVLFIPKLRGKSFIQYDGTSAVHDGYVFAGDTGGAIKLRHIDFFSGAADATFAPGVIDAGKARPFEAYFINDADVRKTLLGLHERQKGNPPKFKACPISL